MTSNMFRKRTISPPPYSIGPIGGGSTFWIFFVNFGPMVTKNFLATILDTWGSWPIFFDSLSVSGQNMGGVKMKMHQKSHFLDIFVKIWD